MKSKHTVKVTVRRNSKLAIGHLLGNGFVGFIEWLSDIQAKYDKPVSVRR